MITPTKHTHTQPRSQSPAIPQRSVLMPTKHCTTTAQITARTSQQIRRSDRIYLTTETPKVRKRRHIRIDTDEDDDDHDLDTDTNSINPQRSRAPTNELIPPRPEHKQDHAHQHSSTDTDSDDDHSDDTDDIHDIQDFDNTADIGEEAESFTDLTIPNPLPAQPSITNFFSTQLPRLPPDPTSLPPHKQISSAIPAFDVSTYT